MSIVSNAPEMRETRRADIREITATRTGQHLIAATQAQLAQLAAQVDDAFDARRNLLRDTLAELSAAGFEAIILEHRWRPWPQTPGSQVNVQEVFTVWESARVTHEVNTYRDERPAKRVVAVPFRAGREQHRMLLVGRGKFTILLVDGDEMLAVKNPDQDTEVEHRKSVARLRSLARKDALRVHARDRDISLIDPLGNAVHHGDIVSAFAFLLNIDA